MTDRIIEISETAAGLSLENGLLSVLHPVSNKPVLTYAI